VCVSLILANPSSVARVSDARFAKLTSHYDPQHHPIPLKLTLIIVNNTLVRQWADEFAKFAPGLKVHVFYNDAKAKATALAELRDADVLITTPHMALPHGIATKMRVHRLIMDEAHLLAKGSTTHSKIGTLKGYSADRKWLVTGTPFSTGLDQLVGQAEVIGHLDAGCRVDDMIHGIPRAGWQPPPMPAYLGNSAYRRNRYRITHVRPRDRMTNEDIVERLRCAMVRHTKSMRIGGEVALALPDADHQTVWLTMSEDERLLYELHHCCEPEVSMSSKLKLEACSHLYDLSVVLGKHGRFQVVMRAAVMRQMSLEGKDDPNDYTCMQRITQQQRSELQRELSDRTIQQFGRPSAWTLEQPLRLGKLAEAAAAFLKTHVLLNIKPAKLPKREQAMIDAGLQAAPPTEAWQSNATLTKFATLMKDLHELREEEPSMRAVVFTRHDAVQQRLVALIEAEVKPGGKLAPVGSPATPLRVFEFNKQTPPVKRHKLIKDFQEGGAKGARVFVVTYATAAVGITLTAANRIFLMEPCLDPALEAQAAGRIHRLGQTKDVFVRRYAFKDSIEEAIVALHQKIKAGDVKIVDGRMPANAHQVVSEAGKRMHPHDFSGEMCESIARGFDDLSADFTAQWWLDRSMDARKKNVKENWWVRRGQAQHCAICGEVRDVRGTSKYEGKGLFSYLEGVTRDPPHSTSYGDKHFDPGGHGRFKGIPRAPDGWRGLRPIDLDNGEVLPDEGSFGSVTLPDLTAVRKAVRKAFAEQALEEARRSSLYGAPSRGPDATTWCSRDMLRRKLDPTVNRALKYEALMHLEAVLAELCDENSGAQALSTVNWGWFKLKEGVGAAE
jgi:hypothetical protein